MKQDEAKKGKKPWPTADAMKQIYEKNLWGGGKGDFYSGSGSHDHGIVEPYVEAVSQFLNSLEEPPVVLDLGCGDFNVGKELTPFAAKFIAVDIVEELIDRNRQQFSAGNLEFRCMDIADDDWPAADVVILRQVLQHLSNEEIRRITERLSDYKYIILTEHIPEGSFEPNIDIISGQGTRLKKGSGVDLKAPPFNMRFSEEEQLLAQYSKDWGGKLVTILYMIGSVDL